MGKLRDFPTGGRRVVGLPVGVRMCMGGLGVSEVVVVRSSQNGVEIRWDSLQTCSGMATGRFRELPSPTFPAGKAW